MRLKSFCVFVLVPLVVFSTYSAAFAGMISGEVKVMVNNGVIQADASPVIIDGVIMVPAKEFMGSLGGTFTFKYDTKTGTARSGENELVFRLDDGIAGFNGKLVQAEAPFQIINNRFMIPARFSAARFGAEAYFSAKRNTLMVFQPEDGKIIYQVVWGDTLWIISRLFGTTVNSIRELNGLTDDMIYAGQKLIVREVSAADSSLPAYTTAGATIRSGPGFDSGVVGYLGVSVPVSVTGKVDNWYKVNTSKGNGYIYYTVIGMKQELAFNPQPGTYFDKPIAVDTSGDTTAYMNYTVVKGDYIWMLSQRNGIPDYELAAANNFTSGTVLYPGQQIKIPVHSIAVKKTPGVQYGEILDWYTEAQYVFSSGKTGKLTDPVSGKNFFVKRVTGAGHSDTETITYEDSQIMKEIFGGSWTWMRKAMILEADGRRLAVSIAGMPHAGVDGVPYLQTVENRSGNYGTGPNFDAISGNGMDGHFDLYFLNSRRHVDNMIDPAHQYNALTAGGLR
ncbi:MAG: LysM peptidoglycan-binding domain-containing protein [Ruminiclostridium sp.]|nr:LysM peptidoglycan-binding domain-containing protein [Ruminiclostridium sp.]